MAQLATPFDPRNYDPVSRPEPLPAGRYSFMIHSVDLKPTRSGDGSYFSIEHEVQGGPFNGRKFFNQITYENKNLQAIEIGNRQMSELCRAVGYMQPLTDTLSLHGRSGEVDLNVEPETQEIHKTTGMPTGRIFPAKNVVKHYIIPEAFSAPSGSAASQQMPQQQRANSRPWK